MSKLLLEHFAAMCTQNGSCISRHIESGCPATCEATTSREQQTQPAVPCCPGKGAHRQPELQRAQDRRCRRALQRAGHQAALRGCAGGLGEAWDVTRGGAGEDSCVTPPSSVHMHISSPHTGWQPIRGVCPGSLPDAQYSRLLPYQYTGALLATTDLDTQAECCRLPGSPAALRCHLWPRQWPRAAALTLSSQWELW